MPFPVGETALCPTCGQGFDLATDRHFCVVHESRTSGEPWRIRYECPGCGGSEREAEVHESDDKLRKRLRAAIKDPLMDTRGMEEVTHG